MMKIRMGLMGLIAFLGSCGKPAAEKVAVPMETSPMFGKLQSKAEKGDLTLTLERAAGKPEPIFMGVLVNTEPSGANACYLIAEVATGKARLVNDNGSGVQELEGKSAVSNQQCELKAVGTRVERSAERVVVHFGVAFQGKFAGKKQMYAIAMDGNGAGKGLEPGGTFLVSVAK